MSLCRKKKNLPDPRADDEALPLEDLALLRQGVYRYLAAAFQYPDEEWLAAYPPIAEALSDETSSLKSFAFWGDWEEFLSAMSEVGEAERESLGEIYTKDLMMADPAEGCSPCESSWGKREDIALLMGELDGLYAEVGLVVDGSLHQTPDHASVQLEFLSALCGLEAEAWAREDSIVGAKILRRQIDFLENHTGRWISAFAEGLFKRRGRELYAVAANAVEVFVAHEKDLIVTLLGNFKEEVKS